VLQPGVEPPSKRADFKAVEKNCCSHQGWALGKGKRGSSYAKYSGDHGLNVHTTWLAIAPIKHLLLI
jgi:hypothetical protein